MADDSEAPQRLIFEAAKRGHKEQIEEELAANAEQLKWVDGEGNTLLHWSAGGGHYDCVEFLVSKGVDVNAVNHHGETPLHRAAWKGNVQVCTFLVSKGASQSVKNKEGKIPLDLARNFDVKRAVAPPVEVAEDDHDFEQEDADSD
eukprot:TRINITY_DN30092_c0_g1_i1.p1 TRINITY_DN30092_c0_g1~~TRINITY_DN30092_c0_g1_i1.p1  ORF type:complete len:154 (+),score=61.61 TRINITY_DN30092_c0_g1_i1:26-463(+)